MTYIHITSHKSLTRVKEELQEKVGQTILLKDQMFGKFPIELRNGIISTRKLDEFEKEL